MSLSRNNVCPTSGPSANAANLLPMGYCSPKGFSIGNSGMDRRRYRRLEASLSPPQAESGDGRAARILTEAPNRLRREAASTADLTSSSPAWTTKTMVKG
ncbi:hypothetical protein D9M73_236570 [compost metagenome]